MNDNKNQVKKIKKPWPTKKAMEQVYEMKLWGDDTSNFYSGAGSHQPGIINPYIAVLKTFLSSFKSKITVCDLGCGDFNVGKELVQFSKKFIAVDIVADLIKHNKENFKAENLEFHCLDISKDNLPDGDCALVRQVLQHISNAEIKTIVKKLENFKYVIVTEHLPIGNFTPNKDIISGQGIRLKKQSGVNLLESPFNLKVKEEKQLLAINLKENKGVIVTTLYELHIY
ncbi:class I SAM-dependent methyltransferase [Polaribacter glomeratus]|uniref:SAM-dependent methyltransferase n=1 Tax=Polaribacter glomeratus TaxID=102 RepID=A0A2S7WXD4_9FLAO|nr:class I SAM-dependent methyltransferase [Polaribacter glomeratus]PQJ82260.1 SAM-dependent methyltransferase [Polaribacter glomeratus]TXD66855.1 class I SAM-dependent methyltransferase [Polaribacter glomeratus]